MTDSVHPGPPGISRFSTDGGRAETAAPPDAASVPVADTAMLAIAATRAGAQASMRLDPPPLTAPPAARAVGALWTACGTLVRRQPAKAVVLLALIVLMSLLWARDYVHLGTRPATAQAAARRANDPADPVAGATAGGAGTAVTAATVDPAAQAALLAQWNARPLNRPSRNLFIVPLDHYPRDPNAPPPADLAAAHKATTSEKSAPDPADQERQRQVLAENLQAQAAQLRLQSILSGPVPQALVDGKLVKEGDVVAEFRVLKIGTRGIIVERKGIRLEIQMN